MERIRDFWDFSVCELRKSKELIKKQEVRGRIFYLKAILKHEIVSFGINAEFPFKATGVFKIYRKRGIKPRPMGELDYGSYNMIHINQLKSTCRLNYDFNMYFESKERRHHLSRISRPYRSNKSSDLDVDFRLKTEISCQEGRKLSIVWPIPITQLLEANFHQTEKVALLEVPDTHWWLELRRNDLHFSLLFHVENPFAKIFGHFTTNLDLPDYKFDKEFRLPNGTSVISSFLVISSEKLSAEKSGILRLSLRTEVEIDESEAEDCQLLSLPPIKQKIAVFGTSENGVVELVELMSENDAVYQCLLRSNLVTVSDERLVLLYSVWTISNVLYLIRMGTLIPAEQYNYGEIIRFICAFEIKEAEEPLLNHFRTILRDDNYRYFFAIAVRFDFWGLINLCYHFGLEKMNPPLANQSHLAPKVPESKVEVVIKPEQA